MASKLTAISPKKVRPAKPKILIYGKEGAGKTWASLNFPNVYYIDCEDGSSLEHYTNVLENSGGKYFGKEQGSQDFSTVIEQIKLLASEEHPYKTLVIDSLSKIFGIEIAKEADRLGSDDVFGASKKPAIAFTRRMISAIDKLDMNVVIICHEKDVWGNDKKIGTTFDAWDKLGYELNLVLNIVQQAANRVAYIKKSRFIQFKQGENFPWTFEEFAKKFGEDVINRDVVRVSLITPEQLKEINRLIELLSIDKTAIDKWLSVDNAESIDEMSEEYAQKVINKITEKLNSKETA